MTTIDYLQIEGLVSRECQPYKGFADDCLYTCTTPEVAHNKYFCEIGSLKVMTHLEEIKKDLKENGPMMMGLRIYEDFMSYYKGIYKYTTGELVGGHAMKLIGYGVDKREGLYWVLQNQWSNDWGELGYIKIKAGEIGIDSVGLSCRPDLNEARKAGLLV
jgi:C1A family cysteine protease